MKYDVIIIGGGVSGCAVARSLSKYNLSVVLLEKTEDLCSGTSKANSGIVHSGYDPEPGTLMAKLNVTGSAMIAKLSKELDFSYVQNGSMIISFDKADKDKLQDLYNRGIKNGVGDMEIIDGDRAREIEQNLNEEVAGALLCNTGGIVDPFGLTYALAENAFANGVSFVFNAPVKNIIKEKDGYTVECGNNRKYQSQYIVNAAGLYADEMHNMVSDKKINITARRGNYLLFDSEIGDFVTHTIFQLPKKSGKGVLITPTTHGNLMIGPTSVSQNEKDDTSTYASDIEFIKNRAGLSTKNIPFNKVITSFSGLRASEDSGDFIIGEIEDSENFFDVAGIKSPGLSCSPAIGEYVADMIVSKNKTSKKENFITTRKGPTKTKGMNQKDYTALIKKDSSYGKIVCRCEQISEGEIIEAINSPIGATSLDGIKRRVRAGMGRCQAGFCTARTMEILCEQLDMKMNKVCKNVKGSELLKGDEE
ncbi:MAG: NAD(P)/FAD-dependent oxidoreductase [Spirochaetaceae bacterium]|nr:NAD(P)/FAD-dependent oxidoreductase [Spirochaetaceae bacterium]